MFGQKSAAIAKCVMRSISFLTASSGVISRSGRPGAKAKAKATVAVAMVPELQFVKTNPSSMVRIDVDMRD